MHWLLKGLLMGALLFLVHQGWHLAASEPVSGMRLAVDLAQWAFAGFGIGLAFRARSLRSARLGSDPL